MAEDTYDLLAKIVAETRCKPNWSFRLVDEDGAKRLVIRMYETNNYDQSKQFTVDHYHPCPVATYNEKTWRRWIFDQCVRSMNHEIGEALRFGPDENCVRPFVSMHGPGEDPYTVHEWRPETDALTTQDGSLREGSV
jgi:hypothetical protein